LLVKETGGSLSAMLRRPVTDDDVPGLVQLFRQAELTEIGRAESSAADIRDLLAAPGLDRQRRTRVLVGADGRLSGFLALHPAPQPGLLRAQLAVSPVQAVDGANQLLDLLAEWACEGAGKSDVTLFQLPGSLATKALVEHGWQIVHSGTRLSIDLDEPSAPPTPKPGIRVRVAETDEDRRIVHQILEAAVADDWNHRRRTYEEFVADQRVRDGYDPRLWWLAELAGTPAGIVIGRDPAQRSWIAWLGVLASMRGRGIARALLETAFAEFRARGRHSVGVDTDTHNPTGAVAVYQRVGMTVVGTADAWRRVYPD
jgi:mycothiol synthase